MMVSTHNTNQSISRLTLSHMRQLHQKLIKFLLTIGQLPSPTIINPKTIHNTINNKQTKLPPSKLTTEGIQQLKLMLTIQRTGVRNILLCRVRIDSEPLSDLGNSLRTECSLCVDVGDFTISTTHFAGKLSHDGHCVRELGFSAAKFAEDFADTHTLEAAAVRPNQ